MSDALERADALRSWGNVAGVNVCVRIQHFPIASAGGHRFTRRALLLIAWRIVSTTADCEGF